MVLELIFEYGEHESSSVAQILNVVRIDCISSSLNRGWFEMVLELLFEYGEHESSSVAQILNVVQLIHIMLHYDLFTWKGNCYHSPQMFWLPS